LGITHAELYRQLEEEKARTKDLEATRTRQVATIADLEAEINRLKLNGYEGSVGVRDENARLRREVVRLQDELDELRRAAAVTERVRLPEAVDWAARLDASERRVRMLEQQLMDETRRWDSERVRLLARLAEAERRWTMPVFYRTSPSPPPPPPLPLHFIPHLPLLPPTPRYVITQRDRVKQPWKYHHGPNSSSLNGNTAKQS
jgi:cell division protein FtsB